MRLGCLPYLNVKPLVYTLERGGLPSGWELVYDTPARLAEMLARNEIAAAPVSSFATFVNPGMSICPGICIAADGPVDTVLMVSRFEPQNLNTVALDPSSLSGATMLKIILAELYNSRPEFVRTASSSLEERLIDNDAALVIGDPAMTCSKHGFFVLDLAEEWKKLTGLPAVFAVWAGNGITPELVKVLQSAKMEGLKHTHEIALEASEKLGLPYEVCENYLTRVMIYDLGERERQGLEVFRNKVVEHGLLNRELVA
jgi:chorismate dehydratase